MFKIELLSSCRLASLQFAELNMDTHAKAGLFVKYFDILELLEFKFFFTSRISFSFTNTI